MKYNKLKVLDLFSGIAGFTYGLEKTGGFQTIGFCDNDPFVKSLLEIRYPEVPFYDDIKNLKSEDIKENVEVITGGFPCQDISIANGKAVGINGTRSGLWFRMRNLIREIRPQWVLIENVPAIVIRGLESVLNSLAEIGYDAVWCHLSAGELGAPHIRERFWCIAFPANDRGALQVANAIKKIQRIQPENTLPTITASQYKGVGPVGSKSHIARLKRRYLDAVIQDQEGRTGKLNPDWLDWFMGYPIGWTDATKSWRELNFRRWNQSYNVPRLIDSRSVLWEDRVRSLGNSITPPIASLLGEIILNVQSKIHQEVA